MSVYPYRSVAQIAAELRVIDAIKAPQEAQPATRRLENRRERSARAGAGGDGGSASLRGLPALLRRARRAQARRAAIARLERSRAEVAEAQSILAVALYWRDRTITDVADTLGRGEIAAALGTSPRSVYRSLRAHTPRTHPPTRGLTQ